MSNSDDTIPPRAIKAARELLLPIMEVLDTKGTMTPNRDQMWWPNAQEERYCCRRISRKRLHASYYHMLNHVMSKSHIARKYGITIKQLNRAIDVVKVMNALEG